MSAESQNLKIHKSLIIYKKIGAFTKKKTENSADEKESFYSICYQPLNLGLVIC